MTLASVDASTYDGGASSSSNVVAAELLRLLLIFFCVDASSVPHHGLIRLLQREFFYLIAMAREQL